ncbi:MAG: TRAP transporter large permease subunit [Arcobacteraceae bacterium]|jgi:tripartite ATP-independent transporter DctM subunit|nr:TRAP transporter large permease subunit [Arcobacteraceae bacterium]
MIGIILFIVAMLLLFFGFPVAFTFGGLALLFGLFIDGLDMFSMMSFRINSIMTNTTLISIPMFIFMGIVLEKAGLANKLLVSMGILFGKIRGGLAISTIIVGMLLAATTGVVGASVVAMGIISLPVMLKYNYDKAFACGVVCTSGTLGQIIPPSIILIILGDVMQVPVGDLFKAAVIPGVLLVMAYISYIVIFALIKGEKAPAIGGSPTKEQVYEALKAVVPPLMLIVFVLGSIFAGIATPTESSAIGAVGAVLLALMYKKLSFDIIKGASLQTVKITAMVFAILIGATAFSMVFTYTGGDMVVEEFMTTLPAGEYGFLIASMIVVFLLGFFLDFVEICFIVVPILGAIALTLGVDPIWFAILIAINLQTSFLTPPFGFSLFYLKGVVPEGVRTIDIYKGVIPFIVIQILVLGIVLAFPDILIG